MPSINDVIVLSTGNDTVNSGNGDDVITAAAGTNTINTGNFYRTRKLLNLNSSKAIVYYEKILSD